MALPKHLAKTRDIIEGYARDFGLDFFETVFEFVDFDQMNMIAAYGGFPTRYPHWKFGMEYGRLAKGYKYGASKIYEMVINNDPSYAYLMSSNTDVEQKLVIAHVYGHVDFFKHNFAFAHTNRKMMDAMANHGTKVRRYIDKYGIDKVESFIDRCVSLDNLIDRNAPYIRRRSEDGQRQKLERDEAIVDVPKLKSGREYMRHYINPEEYLEQQRQKLEDERERDRQFPENPERDVLLFLLEWAPLEAWERDILSMLREEAYYFAPQGQTKIMNEGWATFWHTTIMTQKALKDSEVIDYAERHASTMGTQPGSINPYKLGLELFRSIEERWNRGRFGREWESCDDVEEWQSWDRGTMKGREKIFEVRRHYNDVTFIDEFLTPHFAAEQKLFNYSFNRKSGNWEIATREFRAIKEKLLFSLTNFGQPMITVVNGNFGNRGELLLHHTHEGTDLRDDYMRDTLVNLQALWTRPVVMHTKIDERNVYVSFDGSDFKESRTEDEA